MRTPSHRFSVVAKEIHYKGYIIKSNPEPVATSGQWKLQIALCWKRDGLLNMQPFWGPTVYDSEEEADVHGIAYGQRIIDEKVPGLKSV
jgi:hypothetical protein